MEACKSDSRSVGQKKKKVPICTRIHIFILKYLLNIQCYVFRVSFLLRPYCLTFREFMPSLDEFFAEAIEQADPANMVEDEYK